MNRSLIPAIAGPALCALAVLTAGCYVTTDNASSAIEHDSRTVDAKGAKSVQMEVDMGAGELVMQGGATPLLDAEFRYRGSAKPEVRYDVNGSQGMLNIRQPSHHSFGGNDKNQWTLRVNDDMPIDIHVKMGAGEGRLTLGNTALHTLSVDMGAGELKLDLTGHPRGDIEVQVHGGVGEATVRLPRHARLDVEAHGGLGEITARGLTKRGDRWVNEPSGENLPNMRVTVNGGIGGINLISE